MPAPLREQDAATTLMAPGGPTAPDAPADNEYVGRTLGVGFWIAVGWMALVMVLAVLAPVLTNRGWLQDPTALDTRRSYSLSSTAHWLGTDNLGRDHLARLVWAARVSLPVGFVSIALGVTVGTSVGVSAGYLKGRIDSVLMTIMDIVLAFPALLLAMAIVTFTDKKDITHISIAIGIIAVPAIARLVRANTLTFREREFVLAARTLGASHLRIIVREILPNVFSAVVAFAVIGVAVAIAAEGALAYLGISVPIPQPTWGGMISDASPGLQDHPYQVLVPCAALVITILALYYIGDRLGQFFNVKETAL